ncbi:MAG: glycosyltransferase family 4 protein [Acidobacteria bacterium]|nr:glycosyltransferase family 4 protein [Acidobacteriota bacterium]
MRILQITAGAAGMYCGSCTRDNALARELLRRGHDVTLVPVYTPTRPDEPNVSRDRVLFGGISVYLQQHVPLFRATPRLLDRLWDSPRVIRAFARRAISTDARLLGDLTISMLQGERGVLRKEFDKLADWIRAEPPPDVIDLPNSLLIALAAPLKHVFGRPVCCTMQGEELFLDSLLPQYRERALALLRRQVPTVDRFVAVSDYCARFMSRYLEIPPSQISVVPLGINLEGYRRPDPGSRIPDPGFTIGYFARVASEKGLRVLAEAYIRLRRRTSARPMRLEAAGYLARASQPYLDEVRRALEAAGLGHEFVYRGEVDRDGKLAFLRSIDVLSVPATYDEPKGMFVLEAMASGVPVVQPRRGSFIEMIERTGGGLLVDADDPDALAEGLHKVATTPALRASLADCGFAGVRARYTIAHSADRLLEVYGEMADGKEARGQGGEGVREQAHHVAGLPGQ